MLIRIKQMCGQVCKTMGCELLECSGEADHVHLLVDFHPKQSIAAVAGSLKATTSRMLKKEFPGEVAKWYTNQSFWSGSYYVASTGGAPIEKLKEYIKAQDSPTT
jgi:putative transposase